VVAYRQDSAVTVGAELVIFHHAVAIIIPSTRFVLTLQLLQFTGKLRLQVLIYALLESDHT
jgi:hypothetical protein